MVYLALDLGAGSGRAIVGVLENGKITLDEVHRFNNNPIKVEDKLSWDFTNLFQNIKLGISAAVNKGYQLDGIGVDTWGVDFGLIDIDGELISDPVCYRDDRTQGMLLKALDYISEEDLYQCTGIQQMEINTLFQLLSLKCVKDPDLNKADKLLFIPDLINYFLTGVKCNEYTIASTSQLLNANTQKWDNALLAKFNFPPALFADVVPSGTKIGNLKKELAKEFGSKEIPVFAIGSHDTASACIAIPHERKNCAFLSSGTWSLLGVKEEKPILSKAARINNFTNEGGADNHILFMRNITGLWLLQRLIAEWKEKDNKPCSYENLLKEAATTIPLTCFVDSDHPDFAYPSSMEQAIQKYCMDTNQHIPHSRSELVRCVCESLALKYANVMTKLEECTGRKIEKLYVVGGGSKNKFLNQMIADCLNIEVVTGLTEATSVGNIILQAITSKQIACLSEAHDLIRANFEEESYYPKDVERWKQASIKFNIHVNPTGKN